MKNPSHRDRLIASLPADLQAGALDACHKTSDDSNDGVVGMFAVNIESTQRGFSEQQEQTQRSTAQLLAEIQILRDKLAGSDEIHRGELDQAEQREKKLLEQIAKGHAETKKTVHGVTSAITGRRLWRRVNITQLTGALIWLAVIIGSNFMIPNKVWTLNPTQVDEIQGKIDEQTMLSATNFDKITTYQKETVEYIDSISKTNVTTAAETLIGKGLSLYIASVDDKRITLEVDGRHISVPHSLTPQEYLQLDIALKIAKKIK